MSRAMLLLAGLVLVSQVAVQPVSAAELSATTIVVQGRDDDPHRNPDLPAPADSLSDQPRPDLRSVLISGWWQGNVRHSQFKIKNYGNATAKNVEINKQVFFEKLDGSDYDDDSHDFQVGDMAPGAEKIVLVICSPQPGWACDWSRMTGLTPAERNYSDNWAKDSY